MSEHEPINESFNARHTTLGLLGALDELRDGNKARAIELLEEQLDNGVLWMAASVRQAGSAERERTTEVLRLVREYRRDHPRRPEADMENAAPDVLTSLARVQGEVTRILNDVH